MPGEDKAGADVPEDERGKNQGDCADDGAPPVPDYGKQDAAINQDGREREKREEPKHRKPLKRFQRISVVIQSVSLLVLLAYTGVSGLMWLAMKDSNEAAASALAQGQNQFNWSRLNAARAAVGEKERFQSQLDQAKASLEESGRLNRLTSDLVRQSAQQVGVARQQMAESLRARVYVINHHMDLDTPGRTTTATLYNGGNLAAERFSYAVVWLWGGSAVAKPIAVKLTNFANPISPNGRAGISVEPAEMPTAARDSIKAGKTPLVVWIVYQYGDSLVGLYEIEKSCFKYDSAQKDLTICEGGENSYPPPAVQ